MDINACEFWQEVLILVIVSMLAYFCFLEQLLVGDIVKRQFVWLYAAIQFSFVVIFAHVFYDLIRIHPVLAILLATFAGCGVVMCARSVLVEVLRLRRRWVARSNNQADSEPVLHQETQPTSSSHVQTEIRNVEASSGN
ncbi:hypothetical protein Hdeb2414_s0023g00633791 [Helianthus debilis subsp. tardiflorus]